MTKGGSDVVMSDFDSTISMKDSLVLIFDACIGKEEREKQDQAVLNGKLAYKEAMEKLWNNVNLTKEEAEALIQNVQVDPGFLQFVDYCEAEGIPIHVISSGLTWIVKGCLQRFLGDKFRCIKEVIANDCEIIDRKWNIKWVDDS